VGLFQPTTQSARVTGDGIELDQDIDGRDEDGDGTVPRVSATPLEVKQEEDAMFASERHGSLQNFDPIIAQLRGVLSGLQIDTSRYFVDLINLRLGLNDLYMSDEKVPIEVRPSAEPVELLADVSDVSSGTVLRQITLKRAADGWHRGELEPLPAGAYRLRVSGTSAQAVTDIFMVYDNSVQPTSE